MVGPLDADDATGGTSDRELQDLIDHERRDDAVDLRRRAHWLERQAAAGATLAGLLVDLGERAQLVAVTSGSARQVRGVVVTLGTDFCGLRCANGERAMVALAAIGTVRPEPGTGHPVGDRTVHHAASLAGELAELAAGSPSVSVHTATGEAVTGELRAVGVDLLTVVSVTTGDAISVPLANVADIALP